VSKTTLVDLRSGNRIDWPQVILDLQRSDWGQSQRKWTPMQAIAEACGRGPSWVWALKNVDGTEPKFHDGMMLIGLWAEKTGGTELPFHRETKTALS
jgi:hypothetical protein